MAISAHDLYLESLSELVMENYLGDPISLIQRRGSPTMQFLSVHDRKLQQGSNPIRFYIGAHDSVRVGYDVQRNFHKASKGRTAKLDVKFDPTASNKLDTDVRGLDGVAEITKSDLDEAVNGTGDEMVNLGEDFVSQVTNDLNSRGTWLFHSDQTGAIGNIATGGKKAKALSFGNAANYSNGAKAATLKLSGVSRGRFPRDMLIDIYDGNTLTADALRIIRTTVDDVIVVETTDESTVANLDSVAAGNTLYRTGDKELGAGMPGALNEVMRETIPTTGDSWFRKDRFLTENMHYVPENKLRAGSSFASKQVELQDMTDAVNQIEGVYGQFGDNIPDYKFITGLRLAQQLREDGDSQSVRVIPGDTQDGSRRTGVGSKVVHTTAAIGDVEIVGDHFAAEDRMILMPSDAIQIGQTAAGGIDVMTGNEGRGVFSRADSNSQNSGGSKDYKFEATMNMTFIPTRVIDMVGVFNLTA